MTTPATATAYLTQAQTFLADNWVAASVTAAVGVAVAVALNQFFAADVGNVKLRTAAESYVRGLVCVHNNFKNAMDVVAKIDVDALSASKLATLKTYITAFLASIHNHHSTEDEIVFPAAVAKDKGGIGVVVERLEKQHKELMEDLDRIEGLVKREPFTKQSVAEMKTIFAEFQPWLTEHLDTEIEKMDVEWIVKHWTLSEVKDINGRAAKHALSGDLTMLVPLFFFNINDEDRAYLLTHIPWFPRTFILPAQLHKHAQVWRDWSPFVKQNVSGALVLL